MRLTGLAGRLLCLALLSAAALPAQAAPRSITLAGEAVGDIPVLAPEKDPKLFVVLISDKDGITAESRAKAESFVAHGAAVALVDLPTLISKEAASDDTECHYIFGDFEDISRKAERELGMSNWHWPVLFGEGEGGSLAYLALGQTPQNTAAGAVSLGFTPTLATKLPLCSDELATGSTNVKYTYAPAKTLPAGWRWIAAAAPSPDLTQFVSASGDAKLQVVEGDAKAQFDAALNAVLELGAPPESPLADLPLVELPAKNKPKAVAVFISGDGGWRDIDKQIGDYLINHDVAVVGIDALRYFWNRKSPEQIGADIDRIVKHYQRLWQVRRTALLGYSFGADVLPLTWGKLSIATREATQLIGLIGFEPTADLEVSMSAWLGVKSADDLAVRPYLASMPGDKVLCVFGADEQHAHETACTFPELNGAMKLKRPGGHHFDGNYQIVAQAIIHKLERKSKARPDLAQR